MAARVRSQGRLITAVAFIVAGMFCSGFGLMKSGGLALALVAAGVLAIAAGLTILEPGPHTRKAP